MNSLVVRWLNLACCLVLTLSFAFCDTMSAHAQSSDLDRAARLTYGQGKAAFEKGDYETALARFRQAYDLSPRPELLYNIATSLDRLRRDDETVAALKQYLVEDPKTYRRVEIEKRIAQLEATIAERDAKVKAAEEERQRLAAEREAAEQARLAEIERVAEAKRKREQEEANKFRMPLFVPIALASAAVLAGGLSIITAVDTGNRNSDYKKFSLSDGATFDDSKSRYDGAKGMETFTYVLWISAGTFALAAAISSLFVDWGGKEDKASVTAAVLPGGGYLGASLRF